MKILHVLHSSVPNVFGYTIRSHNILRFQQNFCEPVAITSLEQDKHVSKVGFEIIDGVQYYRCYDLGGFLSSKILTRVRYINKIVNMKIFENHIFKLARALKPSIIHAHSDFSIGIPALNVSASLKIPFVYEIRGLWHETRVALKEIKRNSLNYRYYDHMEKKLIRKADRLITISYNLRQCVSSLRHEEESVFVVPNGVDASRFKPIEKDQALVKTYVLHGKVVLGYIGSLRQIEGLRNLLLSFRSILNECDNVALIIVGKGPEKNNLVSIANHLGLSSNVIFTGGVSHEEILRYYSIVDIFVLPRPRSKVTDLVTPLKPLEAMSMGKAVILSDLQALRELVTDGETGLMFRAGDTVDLIKKCTVLIKNHGMRQRIGKQARKWILCNRNWENIAMIYRGIYSQITEDNIK